MKIKLTKGELKKQRDALKQYLRYLPTLQLKKQQLQLEVLRQLGFLEERELNQALKKKAILHWIDLLAMKPATNFDNLIKVGPIFTKIINIAGVDLPVFSHVDFEVEDYDLFLTPYWVDQAIDAFKGIIAIAKEIEVIKKGIEILRHELRITTQRVNLFEKVKIPETEESIRLIKIYIGDQMSNAIGRSKIAKKKIEQASLEEALV